MTTELMHGSSTMKALVLDGSRADDPMAPRVQHVLESALEAAGCEAEVITVRERRIGSCAGDFFCWVRSPGVCNTDDDNRVIAARIVNSDLVVYLTPITFGGYSSVLKGMVDHQIQNLSPGFALIDGETHHRARYAGYPDLVGIGWLDRPDPEAEAVFGDLVARNARNMHARAGTARVVHGTMSDEELRVAIDASLRRVAAGGRALPSVSPAPVPAPAPVARPAGDESLAPRRAVLLVGSPRTRSSTSNALGSHLLGRLGERGVATDTVFLHTVARSAARLAGALDAVDAADLVVLAFPLYVDSLPAPVIDVMEHIAARRAEGSGAAGAQRFVAIANCGFPEASHNTTALDICRLFARDAGISWAGGLALGAGEGLIHGAPIASLGGRAAHVARALDLTAEALLRAEPVPDAARELLARPAMPGWLYRTVGGLGWRLQARRWGVARWLGRRPYAA